MKSIKYFVLISSSVFLLSCASSQKNDDKVIHIKVDGQGYHPSELSLPRDTETVTLRFLRVTDETCAREVVFEKQSINKKLPLNRSVDVTFDLKKESSITYGCHMNKMYRGNILKN